MTPDEAASELAAKLPADTTAWLMIRAAVSPGAVDQVGGRVELRSADGTLDEEFPFDGCDPAAAVRAAIDMANCRQLAREAGEDSSKFKEDDLPF